MTQHQEEQLRLLRRLRAKIEDSLTDVDRKPSLSRSQALELARSRGADTLTPAKLTYMIQNLLVSPEVVQQGDRIIHRFGREQIRDIILTNILRTKGLRDTGPMTGLSYSAISALYRKDEETTGKSKDPDSDRPEVGLAPQRRRSLYLLRSRIVGVMLGWLFSQQIEPDTLLHIRQRNKPATDLYRAGSARHIKVDFEWMEHPDAAEFVGRFRDDDLVGFVTPDTEVIFSGLEYRDFYRRQRPRWLLIRLESDQPYCYYEVMIGLPKTELCEHFCEPKDRIERATLALLLDAVTLEVNDQALSGNDSHDSADYSTLLSSIAEMIPDLSPLWEYCAILTRDPIKPDHLLVVARSQDFPKEVPRNVRVEMGQLLAGWAYRWDQLVVVNATIGPDDPRLEAQRLECASAAIALPTHARSHCNGVVYVGTRYELSGRTPFDEEGRKVLQILANVVGELFERIWIRADCEKTGFDIIRTPPPVMRLWSELADYLQRVIADLTSTDAWPNGSENLHLTLVRIEDFALLKSRSPVVAEWVVEHILNTTYEFFLRHHRHRPLIFRQSESPEEFVLVVPRLVITDERDRELRDRLRDLLNSIYFPFSKLREPYSVRVHVWSMPFSAATLCQVVSQVEGAQSKQAKVSELARKIEREAEEALLTLSKIEKGHRYEAEGAYSDALEQYLLAHLIAPQNRYLIRHIAKMHFALGDFEESILWWEKLLEENPVSKHFLRYGYVLAANGQFDAAGGAYDEAHRLDPNDPIILLEWGDLLYAQGKVDAAIEKYEAALDLVEQRDILWLRLAKAYLKKGDSRSIQKAELTTQRVLKQRPQHQSAKGLLLQIQAMRRRST